MSKLQRLKKEQCKNTMHKLSVHVYANYSLSEYRNDNGGDKI